MAKSVWMETYGSQVEHLARELEYYILQGSSDGKLDLRRVAALLKSTYNEVARLDREVETLREDINRILKGDEVDVVVTNVEEDEPITGV